jgi:anti-anti-sigma factor
MEQPFRVERLGDSSRLSLRGTVNLFTVSELHAAALGLLSAALPVEVDCAEATHLDGAACQVMLALRADLRRADADLALVNVPDAVRRFLDLAGMSDLVAEAAS